MMTPREFKRLNYPEEKAVVHNTAVGAGADILATALSPTEADHPVCFRAMVSFSVIGILSVTITRALNTQVLNLNSGGNLVADALYAFDVLVHSGDTINFRYSAPAILRVMRVQEIKVGAQ